MTLPSLYYDKNDHKLLEILNDLTNRGVDRSHFKTILEPYLRPHGIKELAAEPGLRIGYAIMQLLQSLTSEQSSDRIKALIALRDETLAAARGSMRNNRARVLVQIGKELIRARGDDEKQLELAHDFRRAALGKIGFLRRQMKKYHLLEMPEEWNQVTFDDRVHDANSKGRKSATHLIMDAWVKGIRHLTVVYYEFMEPAVARELFASARILDISVRVGIEYRALFRGKLIKIVWSPNGLQDDSDRDEFFRQEAVQDLMRLGRQVQADRTGYVRAVTERFNEVHRQSMQQEFGILPPPINYEDVARVIGTGQPSIFHLGNHIHERLMPLFANRVAELRLQYAESDYDTKAAIAMQIETLDSLDAETIVERYLVPAENPDIPDPDSPGRCGDAPELLRLDPAALTARLRHACPASLLTLILTDLDLADVIEILYDCEGRISHFEIFNIKSLTELQVTRRLPISKLLQAINEHNAVTLKRMISYCIDQLGCCGTPEGLAQRERLEEILTDFHRLLDRYRRHPLKGTIGSGSTGRSTRTHGMGFAVVETLPLRSQREVRSAAGASCIPVVCDVASAVEFVPPTVRPGRRRGLANTLAHLPGVRGLICAKRSRWRVSGYRIEDGRCGNVVSLGGMSREGNGLQLFEELKTGRKKPSADRVNTTLKNLLKVLLGFIPAFLTFYLTKEWWVLAYLGGVIWFAITGVRNIIQSVLGGGGLRRSAYLTWHDYIDWERIADSLLYTGFSVPLLDWLCKSMVLDRGFGITTATDPLMLYTIMALTNGVYISTHNLVRGLPRKAALGNFFRSVFSIPVAFAFNMVVSWALALHGVTDAAAVLQLWAAVISKFASDCVAGIIEGLADRGHNIAMRHWDYTEKIRQVFELFAQLEIAFPTRNMLETLSRPEEFIELSRSSGTDHVSEVMANALDLLYIRMYKPRAREALRLALATMNEDELDVFLASQQILAEEKEVAMLFVNGLVGRNFSKALSFYLVRYRDYLDELDRETTYSRHRPEDEPMPEVVC
ncbi:hypothetical protein [Pseudodesulfovibrio sp.]|uniref:hypothetical protein n=1 Tax=Pseudodesulfovibrio sp. TaxID=2035812 RepID=UPI0026394D19|nr:hypothetical protein [Pseudodesulfovibrio sp.]MDD3310738.1 hypothetical protein [Pseudodesulfovibrio sp.]